jgi:hypothetical protein
MTPYLSVESDSSQDEKNILPEGQDKFRINR